MQTAAFGSYRKPQAMLVVFYMNKPPSETVRSLGGCFCPLDKYVKYVYDTINEVTL